MSSHPKNNVEVAGDFSQDCHDLLTRYDKTIDAFSGIKSRRFKCFNDLRSAYECILKAIIAYHQPRDMERKALIHTAERHGHQIASIEQSVVEVGGKALFGIEERGELLDRLPVGLRYRLDGYDFLEAHEDLYYETIGCDPWLTDLREHIGQIHRELNERLSEHSGIINVADIPIDKILNDGYNKFRERKVQQTASRGRVKKRGS